MDPRMDLAKTANSISILLVLVRTTTLLPSILLLATGLMADLTIIRITAGQLEGDTVPTPGGGTTIVGSPTPTTRGIGTLSRTGGEGIAVGATVIVVGSESER